MSETSSIHAEVRRKRVRKGTRSCWECKYTSSEILHLAKIIPGKRRKIKCIYRSEGHSICVSCAEKGTNCLSQEYEDTNVSRDAGNATLARRLEKVEALLEKLTEQKSQLSPGVNAVHSSGDTQLLTPVTSNSPRTTSASNDPMSRSEPNEHTTAFPRSDFVNGPTGGISTISRTQRLQQQLAALLPCQADIDYLWTVSRAWWLLRRQYQLKLPDESALQNPFNVKTVAASHPLAITRLLLCVALCVQQLPASVDMSRLRGMVHIRQLSEDIMHLVTTAVTCDDDLICHVDGVECLVLQGLYNVNSGNVRRAWLAFRRGVSVAQLIGIHKSPMDSPADAMDLVAAKRHYTWYRVLSGVRLQQKARGCMLTILQERYLSLVLGLPSSTSSMLAPCGNLASFFTADDMYSKQLCDISGMVLTRNQGDPARAFNVTHDIDEKLESLAKSRPRSWWEISDSGSADDDRSEEAAGKYERLMCQIWHQALVVLTHLPFLFRAAEDRRFEYSRVSCLAGCRGLIERWMVSAAATIET